MSGRSIRDPLRWREVAGDDRALESRAAELAAAAIESPPLGEEALARVRQAVLDRRAQRTHASRPRLGRVRIAFAVGLVLLCVTTVGGARLLWRRLRPLGDSPRATPIPAVPLPGARRFSRPASPRIAVAPDLAPTAGRPTAGVAADAAPRIQMVPPAERTRPISPPGVPSSSRVEAPAAAATAISVSRPTEAKLIAGALSSLRQQNDPRAALVALDRYDREFPHGVLEAEASRTRVEALLSLPDLGAALATLDRTPSLAMGLGADLLLTRAELRASVGRYREALADFSQLLAGAPGSLPADGAERMLYGRAVCLGYLGDADRARADLTAYQRRFPAGRFSTEVARLLAGPAPGAGKQRP